MEVEAVQMPDGYLLRRSDGQEFQLRWHADGQAWLFKAGGTVGLVNFHINIADKISAAKEYVIAYLDAPTHLT